MLDGEHFGSLISEHFGSRLAGVGWWPCSACILKHVAFNLSESSSLTKRVLLHACDGICMLEIWHGSPDAGLAADFWWGMFFLVPDLFARDFPRFRTLNHIWTYYMEQPWISLPRPRQGNIDYNVSTVCIYIYTHLLDLQEQYANLDSEWPLFWGRELGHNPILSIFNLKRGTGCHLRLLSSYIHPNWGGRRQHDLRKSAQTWPDHRMNVLICSCTSPGSAGGSGGLGLQWLTVSVNGRLTCLTWWLMVVTPSPLISASVFGGASTSFYARCSSPHVSFKYV